MSTRWNPIVIPSAHEEWRDIPGYEGIYQVSETGRVKYCTFRGGRDGKRYKPGMEKKISCHRSGYFYTSLTDHQGIEKKHYIHRLMMTAFQPIENAADRDVNHIDGDKSNNSLTNLEWATHKENLMHAREILDAWKSHRERHPKKVKVAKGIAKGEAVKGAKLTADGVREVRRLWAGGVQQTEIAKRFSVTPQAVCNIVHRKAWAHIE